MKEFIDDFEYKLNAQNTKDDLTNAFLEFLKRKEQEKLRKEYLKVFRGRMEDTLMNTKVVDVEGNDITPKKLLEEQNKRRNNNHME